MRKRKMWKPIMAAMLSAVMIAGNAGMTILADSSSAGGKWVVESGKRYYEVNGEKVTGLREIDGKQYAFNEDGSLIKPERVNLFASGEFMEIEGQPFPCFVTFSGEIMQGKGYLGYWHYGQDPDNKVAANWYYVGMDGTYLTNTMKGIGSPGADENRPVYMFDEKGFMIANELKDCDGYKMYFTNPEDGSAAKNKWMYVDGGWHLFNKDINDSMKGLGGVTGTYTDGDKQYEFDSEGVLTSGNAPYGEVQSVQLGNGEDGEAIEIEAGKEYKLPLSFITSKPGTGEANAALDMVNELLVAPPVKQNGETQPEESTAQETKPEESTAQETQPEESTAQETKPEESTAQETKPEESTAQETKPEESTAQETKPEESTAQETKPEESTSQETQPEESTAQETQPEESTAQETKPEESTSQETQPEESTAQESTTEGAAQAVPANENLPATSGQQKESVPSKAKSSTFSALNINKGNYFSVMGAGEEEADQAYNDEVVYKGAAVSDVLKKAYDFGLSTENTEGNPYYRIPSKVNPDGTITIKGNMPATFTVQAEIDGVSSYPVTITIKAPTSKGEAGAALKDLKDQNPAVALNQLKSMDKGALMGAVLTQKDDYRQIDNNYMFENNIVQEITVDPDLNEQFDGSKLNVAGAALNAAADESVEFKMTKPAGDIDLSSISQSVKVPVDLTLNINGAEPGSLDVPVLVTLPVPSGISPSRVGLYHIHDGQTQRMDVSVNTSNRTITFATDGFSTFVVVENPSTSSGSGGGGSSTRIYGSSTKAPAIPETPGSWNQLAGGKWQFVNKSGQPYMNTWVYANGHWYWIDAAATMTEGWQNINGKRYYLTPVSGAMVTGWYKDGNSWYYLDDTGAMKTGWVSVDNKWYYLGTDGVMLANTVTPDGYKVDASGAWVK